MDGDWLTDRIPKAREHAAVNQDHLSTSYASSQVGFQVEHSPLEEGDFWIECQLNANCSRARNRHNGLLKK